MDKKKKNPTKQIHFSALSVSKDVLFAPETYLLDSYEPIIEEIWLPETSTKPGTLNLEYKEGVTLKVPNSQSKVEKIKTFFRTKGRNQKHNLISQDKVYVDCRQYYPENLAHSLIIHLPLALHIQKFLELNALRGMTLIFPEKLPKHIQKLFTVLGFDFILSDGEVQANACLYELELLVSLRSNICEIIEQAFFAKGLLQTFNTISNTLPKKLFISRKDSRMLKNERSVELFLMKRGFTKVYMEDYDILEQLCMIALADDIVAIHGAALGPLIFKAIVPNKQLNLVELFPPAHLTNVYRVISEQVNANWIGVRGKLSQKHIKYAYNDASAGSIRRYSLNNFEICMKSLERALSFIDNRDDDVCLKS